MKGDRLRSESTDNGREYDEVVVTIDTEWCPDTVIADTVGLLDDHGVSGTLFSTHDDGVNTAGHERALHPNFLADDTAEADALASVARAYPDATGLRSHGMYVHSPLRREYGTYAIEYESNYAAYLVEDLNPFWMFGEVVQFPVYFMDDTWLRLRDDPDALPSVDELLCGPGLQVLGFHPVHVYLNTPDIDYYQERKDAYDDRDRLREERYEGLGVRDLFVAVLKRLETSGESRTLGELARAFRETTPYESLRR